MPVEGAVRDYLLLALRLGDRHPRSINVYSGDDGLRDEARAAPAPSASELVRAAGELAARLPDAGLPPLRERFMAAQLVAMECRARRLAGQAIPFAAELAASYDTPVAAGSEDDYRAAHRDLDDLLPRGGNLAERLAAHHRRDQVPRERLGVAVEALSAALGERAGGLGLVGSHESVVTEIVDDAPWSALHRRDAPGRSRVFVSAGARPRRAQLARLVAHEGYAGHHTEQCRRETVLVGERGWDEHRVVLLGTPQSLLAEGAAELGLHVLVGPRWGRWADSVLDPLGLGFDGELAERVGAVMDRLARARLDAALLLHGNRSRPDDVRTFLRRWLLIDDGRANRVLGFLADPRWRGHTATYVEGAPLVRRWLDRPGPTASAETAAQRLRELHDGPWTPSGLRDEMRRTG